MSIFGNGGEPGWTLPQGDLLAGLGVRGVDRSRGTCRWSGARLGSGVGLRSAILLLGGLALHVRLGSRLFAGLWSGGAIGAPCALRAFGVASAASSLRSVAAILSPSVAGAFSAGSLVIRSAHVVGATVGPAAFGSFSVSRSAHLVGATVGPAAFGSLPVLTLVGSSAFGSARSAPSPLEAVGTAAEAKSLTATEPGTIGSASEAVALGSAKPATKLGSTGTSEALGTTRSAEALRTAGTAEALRTTGTAEALRTTGTAEALGTARSAEALRTARSAEALRTARSAEALRTTGTAEALRTARSTKALRTTRSTEALGSTGSTEALGTAGTAEALGTAGTARAKRPTLRSTGLSGARHPLGPAAEVRAQFVRGELAVLVLIEVAERCRGPVDLGGRKLAVAVEVQGLHDREAAEQHARPVVLRSARPLGRVSRATRRRSVRVPHPRSRLGAPISGARNALGGLSHRA